MAKSTRSRPSPAPADVSPTPSAAGSDDAVERVADWARENARTLLIGVAVIAAAGAGIGLYRANEATRLGNASQALYAAQVPLYQGNLDSAATALRGVAERYAGTTAGEQAAVVLAEVHYDRGQFDEGDKVLQALRGKASPAFRASVIGLLAAGLEARGQHAEAAAEYANAAKAAASDIDRELYELAQARMLIAAGRGDEAEPLLRKLADAGEQGTAQEARVRLGALVATR